jgi:hypothetical protein
VRPGGPRPEPGFAGGEYPQRPPGEWGDAPTGRPPAAGNDGHPPEDPQSRRNATLLLAGLAIVLLAVLPSLFLVRDMLRDPVYASLDALAVPGWAKIGHDDMDSGNRYCFGTCRLRERVLQSARPTGETDAAYEAALRIEGWTKLTSGHCPTGQPGVYTCWQRDQYVLDLWTRDANCATSQNGGPNPGPSLVVPSNEVEGAPSAAPSVNGSRAGPATAACPVSQVTVKVANRADPLWHN